MPVKMHPPHVPRLACLIYILLFMIFYRTVSGANEVLQKDRSNRETCDETTSENSRMHCCNGKLYNPGTDTCCRDRGKKTAIFTGLSEKVSKCCGLKAYNPLNEICCNFTIQPKSSPMAECCGKEAIDIKKQLCCGPKNKILTKDSPDHRCCLENQYNIKTQCCCPAEINQIKPKGSDCCDKDTDLTKEMNIPINDSPAPKDLRSHFCGSTPYDPKIKRCCQRTHGKKNSRCPLGQNPSPTVYDPNTDICCDGCLTRLKPWMDQCCGDTPYGVAQIGVLCCKNILYSNREDGEECSENGVPYKPFTETVCVSKRYNSPGGHCCGEELYQPNKTICCKGQRYDRAKHIRCCGVQAYNISDQLQKCCEGTLYNLTSEEDGDMQCCGSVLLNVTNQEVCCTSEDQSMSYPATEGFQCCGHHYYNPALWSCCAGKLSPVYRKTTHISPTMKGKESRLQLVNSLNKTQLCSELFIGVVESVSQSSTVFSNVLKIKGKEAIVEPDVFILETPDQCKFLRLTAGKIYFFNHFDIFTDFNHESVLQSLHFILSKCF
ncbi:uncharacterized protein FYW61_001428 [Anableps anableps]